MLEFLQDHFSAGLSPCTLKVYVADITAFHSLLGGGSLGKHHLVTRFLHGTLRMRPAAQVRILAWDLAVVLEGLSLTPFEPLDSYSKNGVLTGAHFA